MKWTDPILMEEKDKGIIPYLCQYYQKNIDLSQLKEQINQTLQNIELTPREYLDCYTTGYQDPALRGRIKYGLPITFCIDYNLYKILEFLFIEYNMNPIPRKIIDGMGPLHLACINGNIKIVELLINSYQSNGYDLRESINQYSYDYLQENPSEYPIKTPLIYASIANHTKIVKLLMENGANPRNTDENGDTAFYHTFYNAKTKNLDIAAMVTNSCYDIFLLKWNKIKNLHINHIIYPEDQNTWNVNSPEYYIQSQRYEADIPKLNLETLGNFNYLVEEIT